MPRRWGKRLILRKQPTPYRVICLGSDITYGQVGGDLAWPYNPIADGIGYVERLAQRMGPYYEFINAGVLDTTIRDFIRPADPVWPSYIHLGGAWEYAVEPHLEANTGQKIDIATLFFGPLDAALIVGPEGLGWFEDAPLNWFQFTIAVNALVIRLVNAGIDKILLMTPFRWEDPDGATVTVDTRLLAYTLVIRSLVNNNLIHDGVGYIDLYSALNQSTYFVETAPKSWFWPIQAGHDRIATLVSRHLRQSAHYRWWGLPGGAGQTAPFKDTLSYAPEETP